MSLALACIAAFVLGFVGSMPLAGPVAILMVSRGAEGRHADSLRIGLGSATGEGVYAGVAFWGFSTFLARHALVLPISRGLTAVLLVVLGGYFVAWRPRESRKEGPGRPGTFWLGLTISGLNPTLLATWSAVMAALYAHGVIDPSAAPSAGHALLDALAFGLAAGGGVAVWCLVLVSLLRWFGGKVPTHVLTWVVRSMGVVLIGIGVWSGVSFVRYFTAA